MTVPTLLRGRYGMLVSIPVALLLQLWPGGHWLPLAVSGLWLLIGAPAVLWRAVAFRAVSSPGAAFLVAVGLTVLTDMVVALTVNFALPLAGVERPLERDVLACASAMVLLVLGALAPDDMPPWRSGGRIAGLVPVGVLCAVALTLSVAGPVRLNNGLGGAVSVFALVVVAALLVLLMVRRERYRDGVVELGLYASAASLLLLTSLRGWYITGHDIQREYLFFRLTLGGSYWDISAYNDPYNACLSVIMLPISLVRMTGIPDFYVFKAVLPLLFALTPVLVHRSVRHVAPKFVALLSAVFFMVFPTFFTDMAFLGRQEMAFLLLGCAMVVLTDTARPMRLRRILFTVLLAGIVLAHYSTTYVVVATLGMAWAVDLVSRVFRREKGPRRSHRFRTRSFLTWWMVLAPAVLALVWAGPVTHTGGQLRTTLTEAADSVLHPGGEAGSSDTSYSIFGGTVTTPEQRLAEFERLKIRETAERRADGELLPLKTVRKYPLETVEPESLPLSAAGRMLDSAGVDVAAVNAFLRQSAAQLLQVLLLIGLVAAALARLRRTRRTGRRGKSGTTDEDRAKDTGKAGGPRRNRHRVFVPERDQITLSVASLVVVGLMTVVPQLSVDYGVLRAFQQGLFFFAPFVATGLLWLAGWLGRWAAPVTCALVTGLFLDLTGVVPKMVGGYPAQLHLDNAGRYYDNYYPMTEERLAAYWLQTRTEKQNPRPGLQTENFTYRKVQTVYPGAAQGSNFPLQLSTHEYVLLGSTTVWKDEVTLFYRGDLVTYRYPTGLLDETKNLIYSSEGAEIYR
ncbi:hypothetical protein SRB5_29010 [Streptomyces sp. RB5]|uniref:Uncharacterized protein n=1 Tax=Streptomyces smaragdinus TaxID=2585196 RepID=A0A7K0CID2_9ACTN|nr:DUF2206 domain-containing protein [Streptomyces smaragdinus]MQY12762.1 hypothetical protein [Streptomyces smaragdinus]